MTVISRVVQLFLEHYAVSEVLALFKPFTSLLAILFIHLWHENRKGRPMMRHDLLLYKAPSWLMTLYKHTNRICIYDIHLWQTFMTNIYDKHLWHTFMTNIYDIQTESSSPYFYKQTLLVRACSARPNNSYTYFSCEGLVVKFNTQVDTHSSSVKLVRWERFLSSESKIVGAD